MSDKHMISVKSIMEYHGSFDKKMIGESVQMDLEFQEEKSVSFTCDCGERFYKREKAEQHLLNND